MTTVVTHREVGSVREELSAKGLFEDGVYTAGPDEQPLTEEQLERYVSWLVQVEAAAKRELNRICSPILLPEHLDLRQYREASYGANDPPVRAKTHPRRY